MKPTDPYELSVEDTQKVPVSSVRFRTTAELRCRGAERYSWSDDDLIITGASGGHVRSYQLVASADVGSALEDDFWVEIPLSEALQRIARSRRFDSDGRHPTVRTYLLGWQAIHQDLEQIA